MAIILFGGEKGGTGKTTMASNMATMRAEEGRDVLLIDTDQQASASYWNQTRHEEGLSPRIACFQKFGKGIQIEVRDLANRYEDIILDAGGRESVELRASLVVCECVFIPVQPSQFDVWTLSRMDQLVSTAQGFNPDLKAKIIINRASPNPAVSETVEAQESIRDFEFLELTDVIVRDRIAFRKAAKVGRSVTELKPMDMKAAEEMKALYREVFGLD